MSSHHSWHNGEPAPREQQPATPFWQATWLPQYQHKGKQFQTMTDSKTTQSQNQSRSRAQPEAIGSPAGAARPNYDQYELNSPENMHRDEAEEAKRRQQAGAQRGEAAGKARNADGTPGEGFAGEGFAGEGSGDGGSGGYGDRGGLGYGASDGEEMADAPDATERGKSPSDTSNPTKTEEPEDPQSAEEKGTPDNENSERGYG